MTFPSSSPADENDVLCRVGEAEIAELADQRAVHSRGLELKAGQVAVDGEPGGPQLVPDRTDAPVGVFRLEERADHPFAYLEVHSASGRHLGPALGHAV